MKKSIKKKKIFTVLIFIILLFALLQAFLFIREYRSLPSAPDDDISYPVRGIDVSHYQGDINWQTLANQNLSFVFIKATEGSSHVDKKFVTNWNGARDTHLKVGAYHFMSFESNGSEQAKNFIENVPKSRNMLPPVVDLELYGDFISSHPSTETVDNILSVILDELENYYGVEPIIYTTSNMYTSYIKGKYDNKIWLADPTFPDTLPDGKKWEFLQYSSNGKLDGYSGYLPHLDLNVYCGSKLEFVMEY